MVCESFTSDKLVPFYRDREFYWEIILIISVSVNRNSTKEHPVTFSLLERILSYEPNNEEEGNPR